MRSFLSSCDDLLGEPDRLLDVAFRQHRQEGALAEVRCSSDRREAPRGNRRRPRPRRAACRRGAPRDSCPTATARASSLADGTKAWVGGGFCEAPGPTGVAGRQQRRRRQARTPAKAAKVHRNGHGRMPPWAAMRQPSAVARRMDFLQAARKDQELCDRLGVSSRNTLLTAVWRHRDQIGRNRFTYWNISARRRLPAAPR